MISPTHADKRRSFAVRFDAWLAREALPRLPEWFTTPFPEDSNIASFLDQANARCMRVEEAEPGDLELDHFFADAADKSQRRELFLRTRNTHERVELIGQVYRWSFFERLSESELDERLTAMEGSA